MSDFLRHIVQRHASETGAVRPRAASRFELPAVSSAPWSELTDLASGAPPRASLAADAVVAPGAARRAAPLGDGIGARGGSGEMHPIDGDDYARRRARSVTPELSDIVGEEAGDPSSPANRWTPAGIRQALARDAVDRRANAPADEHDPVAPQPRLVRPTDRTPIVAPVVARRDGAQGASAPAEPDVVRVHIGRVEVRAVMAPPPERQRNAPSPPDASRALSLEKYLADKGRL